MRNELKQQSLPWNEPSEDSLVDEEAVVQHPNQTDPADMIAPATPEVAATQDVDAIMPYQPESSTGIQVPKPVSEPEFNDAVEAANGATGTPVSSLEELAATLHNLACNGTLGPPADAEAAELAEPEADYFVEPEAAELAEPEADYSANADLERNTFVPSDNGSKSIGRKLREARERLHLSVSEVAEATRIRNDYIIALEQHTINEMPLAPVYVKSYIKSLCRHYDIRADAMLTEYTSALPQSKSSHAGLEKIDGDPPATNGEERFSMAVKWSMVAIFALIAVLTISFFVIDRNLDIATAPPASTLQPLQEKDLGRFMPPSELLLRKLEVPEN
jgi:transcriptional regulator with XRE-family HTH domain